MRKLVFATNNAGKLKELREIFNSVCGGKLVLLSLADAGCAVKTVEDSDSYAGNAFKKAAEAVCATGLPCIGEDSGLEVEELDGAPGLYSARFAGDGASAAVLTDRLLEALDGVPRERRAARFVCVMCAVLPCGKTLWARGVCEGRITDGRRGEGGFGYDPVFCCGTSGKTFAEMSAGEKNSVSHRAAAGAEMARALLSLPEADYRKALDKRRILL